MAVLRRLTETEKMLLDRFATVMAGSSLKTQLQQDIWYASVESENETKTLITFDIGGYERPPEGKDEDTREFPLEGNVLNSDGTEIIIRLHMDANDRLYRLELIPWDTALDNTPLCPDWKTLKVEFFPEDED